MRFRLIRRGTAAHSAVPEKPAPAAPGTPAPPKARISTIPTGGTTARPASGKICANEP